MSEVLTATQRVSMMPSAIRAQFWMGREQIFCIEKDGSGTYARTRLQDLEGIGSLVEKSQKQNGIVQDHYCWESML